MHNLLVARWFCQQAATVGQGANCNGFSSRTESPCTDQASRQTEHGRFESTGTDWITHVSQQIRHMQAELEASRAQVLRLEAQNAELRSLLLQFSDARTGSSTAEPSSAGPARQPSLPFDFQSLFASDRARGHIPFGPDESVQPLISQSVDDASLPHSQFLDGWSGASWSQGSRKLDDSFPPSHSMDPIFSSNTTSVQPISQQMEPNLLPSSSVPFSAFQLPSFPVALDPEPMWMMEGSSLSSTSSGPSSSSTALTPANDQDTWMSELLADPFLFTENNKRQIDDLNFLVGWDSTGLSEAKPDVNGVLGNYVIPVI